MILPPFHTRSEPAEDDGSSGGDFYALAFASGRYNRNPRSAVFFVLCWSPSLGFTNFSSHTFERDTGTFLAYSRGVDDVDSVEMELWRHAQDGVPLAAWRLFPLHAIDPTRFASPDTASSYDRARQRLCRVLYNVLMAQQAKKEYPSEPLFLPDDVAEPSFDEILALLQEIHE